MSKQKKNATASGKKMASSVKNSQKEKRTSETTGSEEQNPWRDEHGRFLTGNKVAEKWTEEKVIEIGKKLIDWMKESTSNFWLEDFLLENDLFADFTGDMAKRYPRFAEYIARAKQIQESRISKLALLGQLDTGMARWVLSVHHGKRDVQETKTELSGTVQTTDRFTLTIENN